MSASSGLNVTEVVVEAGLDVMRHLGPDAEAEAVVEVRWRGRVFPLMRCLLPWTL